MFEAWLPLKTPLERFIWLRHIVKGGGAAWVWKTITGSAPLTLANAVHHAIQSLTQYGLSTQSTTPTPTDPVDIVCNNGVLRYGPMGANLLDPSAANVLLGYYVAKADGEVRQSPANFMFAKYMPVEPGKTYVAYGRAKSGGDLSDYNRIAWYDSAKTWIKGADYVQNRIAVVTAPENAAYARFSVNPSGTSTTTVTQEIVDSYNWMFAEGTAEITPFVPFVGGIYTDGTPETLKIIHNLYDASGVDPNHYYDPNGVYTETQTVKLSNRVPVKSGDVIVCTTTTAGTGGEINIRYNQLDTSGEWVSQEVQSQARNTTRTKTVTINQDGFFCFSGTFTGTTYVDFDATVISIESETQTVTVPMLLGVNDAYRDEEELIHGIKTGRVGVKVFDGTEDWVAFTSSTLVIQNATSAWGAVAGVGGYCTHLTVLKAGETTFAGSCRFATAFNVYEYKTAFGVANVAEFKAKLASEYTNGTPVIVLYPLATETTEQTQAHALHTSEGDNVVDVTANVSPVELEVEYASTPSLGLGSPNQNEGE